MIRIDIAGNTFSFRPTPAQVAALRAERLPTGGTFDHKDARLRRIVECADGAKPYETGPGGMVNL